MSGGVSKVAGEDTAVGDASREVDSEGPFEGLTDIEFNGATASMPGAYAGMIRGLTGLASLTSTSSRSEVVWLPGS